MTQSAITMLSTPIAKESLDRAAADRLRKAIVSGAVPAGARLTEASLASRLGLSRGTVRAALHRLATEGLVVQRPYAGWDVASLTARDAWELYTLRAALEALAARLAAETIDAAGQQTLAAAFERLKSASSSDDHKEITDADLALHKTIVSLSKHRRLADQYSLVEQQVRRYIASANARLALRELVVGEHQGMVEAVSDGDADVAENLARAHSIVAGRDLVAYLERQEQLRASNPNEDLDLENPYKSSLR